MTSGNRCFVLYSSGNHDMHAHGQFRELPELLIGGRR
jgi:hypothetical protein